MENLGEVYKITCIPNGKIYVGSAVVMCSGRTYGTQGRWIGHKSDARHRDSCRRLNEAIREHGPDAFKVEVIETVTLDELSAREKHHIEVLNTTDPSVGYNMQSGGRRGFRDSTETRMRKSEAKLGDKHYQWGKVRTLEEKQKISEALIQNNNRQGHFGQPLPLYLKFVNHKDRQGYAVVSHPGFAGGSLGQKKKEFVSLKMSLDDKYKLALAFLDGLEHAPAEVLATKQNRLCNN